MRISDWSSDVCSSDLIEFRAGRFSIAGTDRSIGIMEIAERLRAGAELPDDVPHSLNVKHVHAGAPSAFPNGCHVAEVEVDPDTGVVEVVRYHIDRKSTRLNSSH